MYLVVDVGNSTVQLGFYQNETLIKRFGFNTEVNRSEDELLFRVQEQLNLYKLNKDDVDYILFSSVVPSINLQLSLALKRIFDKATFIDMAYKVKTGLAMKCDNPNEVGHDLIADMVAAKKKYGYPSIVVDLGTATKVLLIDKDGFFASAAIMPGLIVYSRSLFASGEQLPNIPLQTPKKVIAKNTIDCMNVGIIYGHLDGFMGIVNRTIKEIGYPCKKILTGGASIYVKDLIKDEYIYDENLCTDGLIDILKRNI